MAGLGETCSHVGAVLFTIKAAVLLRESQTVTEKPAYWLLPSGQPKEKYLEVENIDFHSKATIKHRLDTTFSEGKPIQYKDKQKLPDVSEPTDAEIATFLGELHATGDKPVLLSVIKDYAEFYAPVPNTDTGQPLSELFDEQCTSMTSEQLLLHCSNIAVDISQSQADTIEQQTREQSKSKAWYRFRAGRITASRMKAACSTPPENPSQSLIKNICYPLSAGFTSKATTWGCDHEQQALTCYHQKMHSHTNFRCETSGFVINPELPHIGATPDGIVHCDCCGDGVVEVKCPFCAHDSISLKECVDGRFCLEESNGKLQLKHSHAYFFQVQTQMLVCNKEFADFVVWSENDVHTERIEPDIGLWEVIKSKSRDLFSKALLPELVGKLFSRPCPSAMPTDTADVTEVDPSEIREKPIPSDIICVCKQPYKVRDRVVRCHSEDCLHIWFHLSCMNMKRMPNKGSKWYCLVCTAGV